LNPSLASSGLIFNLINCSFVENIATSGGGALAFAGVQLLSIDTVNFTKNQAKNMGGGAVNANNL
jgi:predicted outer membrane repeat protein